MITSTLTRAKTPRERAGSWLANLTLTAVFGLVLLAGWTFFYPFEPVTKLSITVVNNPVAGGFLTVRVDYCKQQAWVPSDMQWNLLNDVSVGIPAVVFSFPVGCQVRNLHLPLPAHIAPGTYRLHESLVYTPWPWKTFTYTAVSQPFYLKGAE